MTHKMGFRTGEFARICGVNKRTLHYYDEQGIFSPDHVEENGYRSYAVRQLYPFIMIRMLRQMGLDLSEIKSYMAARSPERLEKLLASQEEWLQQELRRLQDMKRMVENQRAILVHARSIVCDRVVVEEMSAMPLVYSSPVRAAMVAEDWNRVERIIMEHMRYILTNGLNTGYGFGALVARDDFLTTGQETLITRFFTLTDKSLEHVPAEIAAVRSAGRYLVTYFKGDYMDTYAAYGRLRAYLAAHPEISPGPYSYEESILEDLSTADPDEYITRIAIPVLP